MQIELSQEQYKTLVKSLALAGWVTSVVNDEKFEDEVIAEKVQEFQELEQYILSKYEEFGAKDLVFQEPETKEFLTYQQVEESIFPILETYEEFIFWDELTFRLSRRDLLLNHGEDAVQVMDPLHRMELEEEYLVRYNDEFNRNDLSRLFIQVK